MMEVESVKLFVLIFLTGLSLGATVKEKMLDMAPNAVDDIFSQCRDQMIQTITAPGGLLETELKASKDFIDMWRSHGGTCQKQIFGATPHHLAALQAYGNSPVSFRKKFNDMVQNNGSSAVTYKEFPFKSLHFLLTDVMQLLNNTKTCQRVYYGTQTQYATETGKEIRFGRFLHARIKASSEIENIESDGEGTLLNITSCSVVNIENYTCTSEEIEMLISPTEVFRVEDIKVISDKDADYKVIFLTHSHFLSNHDCYLFPSSSPPAGSSGSLASRILMVGLLHLLLKSLP